MPDSAAASKSLNRRDLFRSAGAIAAGGLLLNDVFAQENNPGANVGDRTSSIRISALKATPVGPKVYVRIDTNHGITGWGEITGLEPQVAATLAHSLFELLDGENPTRVEFLWQKIFRAHRDMRGGPFMTHTLSAIDMALWDITGKLWGVPVYRLLGGPTRDKVRVYPTPKAHKTGTGGPHPWSGDPTEVDRLVKMVKDTRARVGADGAVMFDAHCAVPPPLLIQFASAIEPYDVLFIEEPAVPGNIDVFKRLKQQIRVPMATGERDRTIWGMLPYLEERCIDILQPDCGHTGGISQMKKIAALAETYMVPLAPHCTMSELGLTASIHAAASVPLFLIHEAYLDGHIMPPGVAKKRWEVDADGYASLPEGPGLGVEIDEQKMAEVAADPKRKFKWPHPTYQDGSVRDY
ncbi:MAG TPA: mandelate racemase/muconate lactonizing enzyme family protein [Planctomycetaceae bacterium]|nr:mandelate racemase/muconate lactonizing enzyme family protein [Planctomycetaceae bacterium]